MIISAKSLSGEYVSIDIPDNSFIEKEFERKYKEIYIDRKLQPFVSVKLFYDNEIKEWSFLVNKHNIAVCLEDYKDSWLSLSLNPHPYIIEMFEELDEKERFDYIYKSLSRNPVAIDFFLKNPNKISWNDMLRYNIDDYRVGEIIHLYKNPDQIATMNLIIKYSPDAYDFIFRTSNYDQIDWNGFLKNKHIKPEWVQYIIDNKPCVWGENIGYDDDGRSIVIGEYNYIFKLRKKHWKRLSKMPIMIPLLKKNIDKICWKEFCENPCKEAIDMLRERVDKVIVSALCNNHSSDAMLFLQEINPELNINKKSWSALCRNSFAIDIFNIIERYKHSIKYIQLSKNTDEKAISMIKKHFSISTLSRNYKKEIFKNLIANNNAGLLVLELFENEEYKDIFYEYTGKILTKPYIFSPDI